MNKTLLPHSIAHAIMALNNEHVIAYPTEAVFSIGCNPDSETAVLRLLKIKQRSIEKGLILIATHYKQLKPYIDDSALTYKQLNKILSIWPRPVTFVFPALPTTHSWLTGRFNSIAVRVTNHPQVISICQFFGKPLVSTSANITGLLPCRTIDEVREQFGNNLPIVIGKIGSRRNPSEIRDAITGECLRKG